MTNSISPVRGSGSAIDLGVAALAALSVGFLTFAMPESLFSSLIGATHLPDVVAAAAPPLGMKARLAVLGFDTLLTFALVWALMRALEPKEGAGAKAGREAADPDAPRLRRADAHPDAPSRRPLFAGADLGEPDEIDESVYELDTPEPVEASEPAPAGPSMGFGRRSFTIPEPSHAAGTETPDPVAEAGRKLPRFLDTEETTPARDPVVPPSQKRGVEALAARLPESPELGGNDSIGSLMQRLERGLSEREEPAPGEEPPLPSALASAAEPGGALSPEGVRHRLRSAITDLNQIANRG